MKCPRCLRPVDHEAASCYSCGYSEKDAAAVFGANQVLLNRVHDAAHCLRKQDRDDLALTLDQLELKFPQILFCAYLGSLPPIWASASWVSGSSITARSRAPSSPAPTKTASSW